MRIRVTERDIDAGERGECLRCPMTLAANRATGKFCWVDFKDRAKRQLMLVIDGVGCVPLPPEARRWVKNFDAGRRVKPLAFAVEIKRKQRV
jgi:hypothetical protein